MAVGSISGTVRQPLCSGSSTVKSLGRSWETKYPEAVGSETNQVGLNSERRPLAGALTDPASRRYIRDPGPQTGCTQRLSPWHDRTSAMQ